MLSKRKKNEQEKSYRQFCRKQCRMSGGNSKIAVAIKKTEKCLFVLLRKLLKISYEHEKSLEVTSRQLNMNNVSDFLREFIYLGF